MYTVFAVLLENQCFKFLYEFFYRVFNVGLNTKAPANFVKQGVADASLGPKGIYLQNMGVVRWCEGDG